MDGVLGVSDRGADARMNVLWSIVGRFRARVRLVARAVSARAVALWNGRPRPRRAVELALLALMASALVAFVWVLATESHHRR